MDIGGTNLRMGLVDETLSVSGLEVIPARQVYKSENTPEALSAVIEDYINRHPDSGRPLMIAAGFPSVVDKNRKLLYSSTNFPGLDGVDIVGVLEKAWAYQPSLTTMPTTSWHTTSTSSGFL